MKKIYAKVIWLLLLFAITTSCSKFLEEKPLSGITVDYLYTTPGGLEVGVNALYSLQRMNNTPEYELSPLQSNVFFMAGTDLALVRTWFDPYNTTQLHRAQDQAWLLKWAQPYQIIDRATALINSARHIEMDATAKNKLVAQARVIRGELYLDLITMFDRILLDTIPTTPENAFDSVTYVPANPADVYQLIDADLDFAITNLDWAADYGRYGQGVARHLKGKSALWQGKWSEAAAQFDAIVDNGRHHLVPIDQVFGQNLNHAEALFVYIRSNAFGPATLGGNNGDVTAGGGGTWFQSVFNNRLYELNTGEMIATVDNGGQALGWVYPNDYLKSLYDTVIDRRYTNYYYPSPWVLTVNNPAKPNFGQKLPQSSKEKDWRKIHWSLKKYHDAQTKDVASNYSQKDIMYYRFAETLLLGAEAHWHLSGENSVDVKALQYVNLVRARAGLANYITFTLDNFLDEHAREMALEKDRWFLLKRLGKLVERQNLHYVYQSGPTSPPGDRKMLPYMVRCPIPQSEIDRMGSSFPQNEGY